MRSVLIFRQNSVGKIVGRIFGFAYNGAKVAYNAGLGLVGAGCRPSNASSRQSGKKKVAFFFDKVLRSIK